ncbi:GNAT family N-acetyltransferase [Sphingomonas sp. PP-CE-1G-424]|uniref:GNAT family N-acetyltransferase n=1 Tax=Sphingomonas sp. PP-CE-1G-424 TaxID=2135658 RepID=UPI0010551A02|nr:GNAT family N-acetyltransferase [Sphingomonas sp. PP-CE-1G-424]TCP73145.1 RimJ/RimL family protein N-acetyltransferase [Sphingomonas sp. PP-CE-1G-424]
MPAPTSAPTLTTARLTLTAHTAADLEDCAAMAADPRVYAMLTGQPRTREDVWIRLLRSIGQWTLFGYGSWIARDTATGNLIGELGLIEARRAIAPSIDATPEVGWTLTGDAQGKGYASEALAAILAWTDARIPATTCIIDPANAPSIRLAERLGYRLRTTGTYRDAPILILDRTAPGAISVR